MTALMLEWQGGGSSFCAKKAAAQRTWNYIKAIYFAFDEVITVFISPSASINAFTLKVPDATV